MKKRNKPGIGLRLFASFIAFAAVILGLLWVFQILFLQDFYKAIKLSRADSALAAVNQLLLDNNTEGLQDSIDDLAEYYDVSIAVYDQNLSKLAFTRAIPNDSICDLRGAEVMLLYKRAVDNGGTYTERFENKGPEIPAFLHPQDENKAASGEPAPAGDKDNRRGQKYAQQGDIESVIQVSVLPTDENCAGYTIVLNSVLTPVTDTVETLKVQLTAISIVTVLAAVILAVLLARQISKPIVRMNATAAKLASGNYQVHFDGNGGCRELDELSDTLNYATGELSQVDRLRSELIANISHDLRTPLTMIAGYAEMMRDIPGENSAQNAEVILQETRRLTTLVNDVLDLSKYKAEAVSLQKAPFSISSCIRETIERFSSFMESSGYRILFEPQEELTVFADAKTIQQVLYNLLSNSINYTGKDKTVRVRQLREDNFARIEVIDSGEGVPEDDLPHIFERYYRSSKTHKRPTVGTGIGLAIVKSILDAHGAPCGVITSVGQGSVFWFKLPLDGTANAPY